jgi:putative intracellular protease/amidase
MRRGSTIMQTSTTIPVEIVLLPERCYRCEQWTRAVVGLWFARGNINGDEYPMIEDDGGWFLEYDHITADVIATACPDAVLVAHGAGPLRRRTTRAMPDGYLANTCHHCGTVLGNWPLHEALTEYRAEGGTLGELPHIPAALVDAALDRLWDE